MRLPERRDFVGWGIGVVSLSLAFLSNPEWWVYLLFSLGGVLLLGGIVDWMWPRQAVSVTTSGSDDGPSYNITSYQQQGGFTGVANVSLGGPQPTWRHWIETKNEPCEQGYATIVRLEITDSYAVPGVAIEVIGKTIKMLQPGPAEGGGWIGVGISTTTTPARAVFHIRQPLPFSCWRFRIVTEEEEDLKINSNLQ